MEDMPDITVSVPIVCPICMRKMDASKLAQHKRRVHKKPKKSFECTVCSASYDYKHTLKRHIKKCHTQESDTEDPIRRHHHCRKCNKTFMSKLLLTIHQKTHPSKKLFACSKCGNKYTLWYNLVRHKRNCSKKHLFSCDKCSYYFGSIDDLSQHMQRDHKSGNRKTNKIAKKQQTINNSTTDPVNKNSQQMIRKDFIEKSQTRQMSTDFTIDNSSCDEEDLPLVKLQQLNRRRKMAAFTVIEDEPNHQLDNCVATPSKRKRTDGRGRIKGLISTEAIIHHFSSTTKTSPERFANMAPATQHRPIGVLAPPPERTKNLGQPATPNKRLTNVIQSTGKFDEILPASPNRPSAPPKVFRIRSENQSPNTKPGSTTKMTTKQSTNKSNGKENRNLCCAKCGEIFIREIDFRQHDCTPIKTFYCLRCDIQFMSQDEYQEHKDTECSYFTD